RSKLETAHRQPPRSCKLSSGVMRGWFAAAVVLTALVVVRTRAARADEVPSATPPAPSPLWDPDLDLERARRKPPPYAIPFQLRGFFPSNDGRRHTSVVPYYANATCSE